MNRCLGLDHSQAIWAKFDLPDTIGDCSSFESDRAMKLAVFLIGEGGMAELCGRRLKAQIFQIKIREELADGLE
jgi:hypothetical protein